MTIFSSSFSGLVSQQCKMQEDCGSCMCTDYSSFHSHTHVLAGRVSQRTAKLHALWLIQSTAGLYLVQQEGMVYTSEVAVPYRQLRWLQAAARSAVLRDSTICFITVYTYLATDAVGAVILMLIHVSEVMEIFSMHYFHRNLPNGNQWRYCIVLPNLDTNKQQLHKHTQRKIGYESWVSCSGRYYSILYSGIYLILLACARVTLGSVTLL